MKGFDLGRQNLATEFDKVAAVDWKAIQLGVANARNVLGGAATLAITGMGMKMLIDKIRNSIRHKAVLDDLLTNDPIIKGADPEEMAQMYATIYNLAPRLALEKPAVREIMQNYAKFGRLDMNTVKLLIEANRSMESSSPLEGLGQASVLALNALGTGAGGAM